MTRGSLCVFLHLEDGVVFVVIYVKAAIFMFIYAMEAHSTSE